MQFHETSIDGAVLIEPDPHLDDRGFFVRVLDAELFRSAGIDPTRFVQENQSRSRHGTLRGLHLRANPSEAKIVRCTHGEVYDVVVDLRPSSPTFRRWEAFALDDRRHLQVYVPPGCGHGFEVLSDVADMAYRHDAYYDAALEAEVRYDDADLGVAWPLSDPVLSERDRRAPSFRQLLPNLEAWFG
jgi:dTDP-4-dehydrorhamnose 3,5-epimerase